MTQEPKTLGDQLRDLARVADDVVRARRDAEKLRDDAESEAATAQTELRELRRDCVAAAVFVEVVRDMAGNPTMSGEQALEWLRKLARPWGVAA